MDDRQIIADLLSALEYHTEQTRPIEFSKVAIEAAREYLRKPVQQWSAGLPPLYPEPEPGVSIKAEYEQPAQPEQEPMHPELRKMWEDYFDKCFRRKPLRDHEIAKILDRERMKWHKSPPTYEFDLAFARAIEAAHGIKE